MIFPIWNITKPSPFPCKSLVILRLFIGDSEYFTIGFSVYYGIVYFFIRTKSSHFLAYIIIFHYLCTRILCWGAICFAKSVLQRFFLGRLTYWNYRWATLWRDKNSVYWRFVFDSSKLSNFLINSQNQSNNKLMELTNKYFYLIPNRVEYS